jgi:hypothetical protein
VTERQRAGRCHDERAAGPQRPGDLPACRAHLGGRPQLDEDVEADRPVNRLIRQRDDLTHVLEHDPVQPPGERLPDHVPIAVDPVDAPGAQRPQERRAAPGAAAEIQESLALNVPQRSPDGIEADLVRGALDRERGWPARDPPMRGI